jgi:hypothetical protein
MLRDAETGQPPSIAPSLPPTSAPPLNRRDDLNPVDLRGARYWAATQLLLEPRFSLVAAVLSMLAYNFFFLPRSIL